MGSHDSALSSTDLILYFEQCCIATGLVSGVVYSLQQQQSCQRRAQLCLTTASCLHRKLSTCWKSWGEPCSGKSLTRRTWWDRPPWLSLSSDTKQCHKTTGGDGLTKNLQRATARTGAKKASWVQSIQYHLPLKLPSLRALKRMSYKQELLHFAQQHSLDKEVAIQDLLSIVTYKTKFGK